MGYARGAFTCLISSTSTQRPENFAVLSLHISSIYAKKRGIAKKLILTIRAIMIAQQIDAVAGDFKCTAWRCCSRNNLSSFDATRPTVWGPGSIPDNWADVCGFLKPPGSDRFWKVHKHVPSPSNAKSSVYVQTIKVAITRHGSTSISSTGATLGPSKATMIGTFPSKNDLQIVHTGPKNDVLAKS